MLIYGSAAFESNPGGAALDHVHLRYKRDGGALLELREGVLDASDEFDAALEFSRVESLSPGKHILRLLGFCNQASEVAVIAKNAELAAVVLPAIKNR